MHVLIVEDTVEVVDIIDVSLKIRWPDCEVTAVSRGSMAMGVLAVNKPDLVILDLGLPDMDGLELLADMRRVSTVPVIILTSRGHEAARVRGLETGADDYIVKPFSSSELLARTQAVLRRTRASTEMQDSGQVLSGDLTVNFETKTARVNNELVPLSRLEWDVLSFMAHHPDRVMAHKELKERAWGSSLVDDSVVKMCIRRIRGKIKDVGGDPTVIVTHRGAGYSFKR